jgi:2-polyprenyl-3-methyl-5-hydroxy-6-metoxy-1,4-benzoquinol methylase
MKRAALEHNEAQQEYYRRADLRRLQPARTPTVDRHFAKTITAVGLVAGDEVLEIGAGLGRFTSLLSAAGYAVAACDLSPELLSQLDVRRLPNVETHCCDAAEIADRTGRRFDRALGFFVLHHLSDLPAFFRGLARALQPGAKIAFCEPNALHLPYYAQITFARGMSWRGDRGVMRMRKKPLFAALRAAGFVDPGVDRYGFLPPVLANSSIGRGTERGLEACAWLEPLCAYQILRARLGER